MGLSGSSEHSLQIDTAVTDLGFGQGAEREVGQVVGMHGRAYIASMNGLGTPPGSGPLWERGDPEEGLGDMFLADVASFPSAGTLETAPMPPDQVLRLLGFGSLRSYQVTAALSGVALSEQRLAVAGV